MTERLFDLDPYLKEFTARVVRTSPRGVVLDRTAFYPTSGGQPCDHGTLNGVEVTDVVEEDDAILHVVSGAVEGDVRGVIDWDRRRDHMQQHHGQHLLSEAFLQVAGAQTTSFHLGREACAIDLDKAVGPLDLERAETLANMVVCDSRPVQVSFYGAEEARTLPLRKPPPAAGRVRVVSVQGFDVQACCGTHPRTTGEVGVITVTGWEKGKDGTRVHFACGFRALREARENARQLRSLGQKLSAGRGEIEAAVDRLLGEAASGRKALEAAERALAVHVAREWASRGPVIAEVLDGKGLEALRRLATEVV
ncbi:MAG TPA: alanyl-tRNA editing protein, partial [Planctomycetota bacterium]|nr:alanyl-tRNA editing protein [Planctomycetota bacterium]